VPTAVKRFRASDDFTDAAKCMWPTSIGVSDRSSFNKGIKPALKQAIDACLRAFCSSDLRTAVKMSSGLVIPCPYIATPVNPYQRNSPSV
jgi:hypothetical protein